MEIGGGKCGGGSRRHSRQCGDGRRRVSDLLAADLVDAVVGHRGAADLVDILDQNSSLGWVGFWVRVGGLRGDEGEGWCGFIITELGVRIRL